MVDVFIRIANQMPAKLLLIGDGPERPELEAYTRSLSLCNDIKFLGKQEQIEDILPIADLFLLPSEYESFGLSALEAMAAEVPVISTNAGGLPEININGFSGFMSNVGDIEDMSKNAIAILSDPSIHQQFKTNAFTQAKRFGISSIVPQYEALYERVMGGKV